MIHFLCPLGHKLSVPDDRAGQPGRCPVCQQRLFVPQRGSHEAEDGPENRGADVAPPAGTPVEARVEVPSTAAELGIPSPELRPAEIAAQEPKASTARLPQPPPVRWEKPVAPAASPPPLPQDPSPTTPAMVAAGPTAPAVPSPPSRAPVGWLAWKKSNALEGYAISRPDPRQLEIAYWLASLLPFAAAFCAAPALPHMQLAGAPAWAQLMLCAAVVHMGYAAWLALLPDVSTIRVGICLFAVSAAAYLAAMAAICIQDDSQLSELGLSGMRGPAAAWCGLGFVVVSLAGGVCGWIAWNWRDSASSGV